MKKLVGFGLAIVFGASFVAAQERFDKYRKVEGYEVRPGVLVTPRFTADRQLCEIGIERRGYSPEVIRLSSMTREEIESIVDELVPLAERGNPMRDFPSGLVSIDGSAETSWEEFENVSIQISLSVPYSLKNNKKYIPPSVMVGLVKWKNRTCK
jgi:hypothetical protein